MQWICTVCGVIIRLNLINYYHNETQNEDYLGYYLYIIISDFRVHN
jgi:hypothetical protein